MLPLAVPFYSKVQASKEKTSIHTSGAASSLLPSPLSLLCVLLILSSQSYLSHLSTFLPRSGKRILMINWFLCTSGGTGMLFPVLKAFNSILPIYCCNLYTAAIYVFIYLQVGTSKRQGYFSWHMGIIICHEKYPCLLQVPIYTPSSPCQRKCPRWLTKLIHKYKLQQQVETPKEGISSNLNFHIT